jgi:hypothetical protein
MSSIFNESAINIESSYVINGRNAAVSINIQKARSCRNKWPANGSIMPGG